MRGDVRKMIPATMSPRASHTTCRCQIVATNVGTSVWPAEYSVASPYSASATTDTNSPLSSWRTRDSTVGDDRTGGIGTCEIRAHGIGDHRNLERRRCGIVGNRHLQGGCRALVDAEVVRDRARHERSGHSPVAGELDDRADDDLRLIGGSEGDEPAMIQTVRVLCRPCLTGDGEVGEA